ncbi:FAD-binding oxidoreductase [Companilactobacillus alimentarius]|uniref:FAD-binding oxidoreductase n=1 Tax=Companilactobacillus alimentarius TaxID=1602 RepID=UPI0028B6B832|nr:FAD-binding oxidoreductase [Companilactobacillus alimentarius]MDT6952802.1 FAD-binding oxidoreductase [Companilactobacillus alimentarius]
MLKKHPLSLYLVWIAILVLLPLPLIIILNSALVDSPSRLAIYDAGVIAYTWWLGIVFLSTRPRWLDRLIGLPAMYFIHGMVGVLASVVATIHVQLSFSMHAIIRNTGHIAWYLAIFGVLYASFFLSGWLVDRFPIAQKLKNKLQFFFKHQLSIWIHRLNFVMIGLIWLHVQVIPRISSITAFVVVFDIYTVVSLGTYAWYKFVSPSSEKRSGQVLCNSQVSDHVRQLHIQLGPDSAKVLPGDFYFLSFPKVAGVSKESHPFSVTDIQKSKSKREITFTIQTSGDFTKSLSRVSEGDRVNLEGPFGRFDKIISGDSDKTPLVLIGMGTGLAPLVDITRAYSKIRATHLMWSLHEEETDIFDEQLASLNIQASKLKFEKHLHRFKLDDYQNLLTQTEIKRGRFIIVGPARGVLETEKILHSLGVSRSHLTDERLTM